MSNLDNTVLQEKVNEIVTTENEKLLEKKKIVDIQIQSKDRLRNLNNSTRKRGEHITRIVIVFVIVLSIYTFLRIASETFTIVPSFVFDIPNFIVVAVGIVYIFTIFTDMYSRDHLYYDKYNFGHPTVDSPEEVQKKQAQSKQDLSQACIGAACCPGDVVGTPVYDASLNLCVLKQDTFTSMPYQIQPTPSNTPNEFDQYFKI